MVNDRRSGRATRFRVERPTLLLLLAVYGGWLLVTAFAAQLGPWVAVLLLGLLLAQHSSLQHEAIHGHPTASQRLNDALVFPALGLFVPYERFRDLHLAHHYDPSLTDPHDDPESNYLDPAVWVRLSRPARALLAVNNTLLGRMLVGPFVGMADLWRRDLALVRAGDRRVVRAWALHGLAVVPVLLWLWLAGSLSSRPISSPAGSGSRSCASGRSSNIRRTSGPARAASSSRTAGRWRCCSSTTTTTRCTTPTRGCRGTGCRPSSRGGATSGCGATAATPTGSYGEVFRRYLFRRKDPVAHPIWTAPEA